MADRRGDVSAVLAPEQQAFYREHGYLVLENRIPMQHVEAIRSEIARFREIAATMDASDERIDLETTHTRERPRIRRIKLPHRQLDSVRALMYDDCVLAPVRDLLGPNLRLHTSKLNMKSAGYGAAVEWHQDWAFYPHTNDDLAAVGIMMDDVDEANGPLLVIPGSHKGPIFDHHADGVFCGAMDPARREVDYEGAVALTGPAGSITIHHARTVHGSAMNTSGRPRRLLLHQYRAADAWPLMAFQQDFDMFRSLLLCGEDTIEPRMDRVPVRLPLPPATHQGSIYENQRARSSRYFQAAGELEGALGT